MRKKRTICVILSVLLIAAWIMTGCASQGAVRSFEREEIPFYFLSADDRTDTEVFFLRGSRSVPYVSPETWLNMLTRLYHEGCDSFPADPWAELELSCGHGIVRYTRESGASMEIDCRKDTITFDDFDLFTTHTWALTRIDFLHDDGFNEADESDYYARATSSYSRAGESKTIDLKSYGLDVICRGGEYYLPVQLLADLLTPYFYVNFLYNTESMIFFNYNGLYDMQTGELSALGEICYAAAPCTRSQELIDFTYGELCMTLDSFYGLKEAQGIRNFDEYFRETFLDGVTLAELLHSPESADVDRALAQLTYCYLSDNHSGVILPSYATGFDLTVYAGVDVGNGFFAINDAAARYRNARSVFYPESVPGYEEVGNTAYITFDSFVFPPRDYYAEPAEASAGDPLGLVEYANTRIRRPGSPIENVVLDLSCNTGGEEDTAIYVASWFLGGIELHMKDTFTGATATNVYFADVDMDRDFTESDSVFDKNLYCIISPLSFSCGNLVPAVFKESGAVTLLGRSSGGGSCAVLPLTTASGNVFQISGYKRISLSVNGSYYDIDQGIEPDQTITQPENFYDRAALTEYINALF